MALSNYRAFYKRKYFLGGAWHEEDEYECSQLSSTLTYPDGYYKAYKENSPLKGGLTGLSISGLGEGCYAIYEPGKVFLGKKYYYLRDLHDMNVKNDLRQFIIDTMEEVETEQPLTAFQYYYKYFSKNNNIFWQNDLGYNILPYFDIFFSYSPMYRNWSIRLQLAYIVTKLTPIEIICDWNKMQKIDSSGNLVELQYGANADIIANGNMTGITHLNEPGSYTNELPNSNEILSYYDRYFEQIEKVRFYILYNNYGWVMEPITYDGDNYFRLQVKLAGQNKFTFLCDVREVPFFPATGFFSIGQNTPTNFLSKIVSESLEANDPYEEDDPYDEDPDDDDNGGDGEFDDTNDEISKPNIPPLSATGASLITIYNPNSTQLQMIANKLWSQDFLEVFKQYFTSPMEAILGLAIIPVNPSTAFSKNVHLGAYDTGVTSPVVDSDYVIIDCGSIPITRYWGSYLDYDPYTKISCYLPYIGEIDINPDQVMQKSLGIYYYVNVITGDIVAVLTADDSVFATAAGNCIRQLPIAQQDYSTIINTAVAAVGILATAGVAGAAGAGAAAASAGTTATASATVKAAGASMAMASPSLISNAINTKKHYQHAGQIGSGSGQLAPQKPFLTIERPNLDLADNYKSFVGYPCNKTLQLGSCHGFTQIESTRLSIPSAIDEEIAEVVELLTKGVIL